MSDDLDCIVPEIRLEHLCLSPMRMLPMEGYQPPATLAAVTVGDALLRACMAAIVPPASPMKMAA